MSDRRNKARLKTYIGGRIEQQQPLATMDCIVRELSEGGARITFHGVATIIDQFTLVLPARGRRFRGRMVWRRAGEAGVAFDQISSDPQRPYDLAPQEAIDRLKAGERERVALRERLEQFV